MQDSQLQMTAESFHKAFGSPQTIQTIFHYSSFVPSQGNTHIHVGHTAAASSEKSKSYFTLESVWDLIRCLYESYHINNIAVKAKFNIYVWNSKHVNFRISSLIFWYTFDISNLPMLQFVLDSFCSQALWQHWDRKHSGFRGLYCYPVSRSLTCLEDI